MTTPHKWAEVIHAFAEGKEIQYRGIKGDRVWLDASSISQIDHNAVEWRIKPQKKTYWMNVYRMGDSIYAGAALASKEQCIANKSTQLEHLKTISFDIEE